MSKAEKMRMASVNKINAEMCPGDHSRLIAKIAWPVKRR